MVDDCHVEKILSKLGQPGRYQILFYIICCIMVYLVMFNYVIISAVSGISAEHRCDPSVDYISQFSNNNERNITTADLVFGKCSVTLKHNLTDDSQKVKCNKWLYEDGEDGPVNTISTKWDLVCGKNFYPMLSNTLTFVGVLVGSVGTGHMSDQYGRRPVLLLFTCVSCLLTCGSVLSPNIYVYMVFRFVAGMCLSGIHSTVHVLCLEQTQAKYNYLINFILLINFLCAITITAFVSWMVQVWWKIQLLLTIPVVLVTILAFFVLPESFHWLVVHKKKEKLDKHIAFAARFNGVEPPGTDFLLNCKEEQIKEEVVTKKKRKAYSIIKVLSFPEIRKRLIMMATIMALGTLSFYIMTLNTGEISKNPYKVIMISSAFDVVPLLITLPMLKKFGKRRWFMACFTCSGVICIVYKFYNHIALMIFGKMFVGVGMGITFMYPCDIFPTVIRNICMGVTVLAGRFGGIVAPQVILLGRHTAPDIPVLLSGVIMLLSTTLAYFLPDMKDKPIPKTIEEVENGIAGIDLYEHDMKQPLEISANSTDV